MMILFYRWSLLKQFWMDEFVMVEQVFNYWINDESGIIISPGFSGQFIIASIITHSC